MPYCERRGGPPSTKLSTPAKSDASIGLSIGEKTRRARRTSGRVDFAAERAKRIFHLSTSRRAVYCRGAAEFEGARAM